MKRYATAFAAIIGACAFATVALAQDGSTATNGAATNGQVTVVSEPGTQNLNLDELRAFDQMAQNHPDMAKALARKPALINSDKFVAKYPDLEEFLGKYPDARDNIRHNPGDYVKPVSSSTWAHSAPGIKTGASDGSASNTHNDGSMMKGGGAMKNGGAMKDGGSMNDPGAGDGGVMNQN
jgi:hypothetical protein